MDYQVRTPSQLASAFKSRRKTCGLSQAQAAAKVGLLPKTVSALEGHPEDSSVESLLKLIAALELELVLRPKDAAPGPDSGEAW
jgi:HTH-type transcriptional regulator / antitoxin HipB